MGDEPRNTLQEMCALYDVTPRTLRYYEYIELLSPEKVGRRRYFGPREHARLKLILRARRMEFPLEDVRQWLSLYDSKNENIPQMEMLVERAHEQVEVLQDRIEGLKSAIAELEEFRVWAEGKLAAHRANSQGKA